MTDLIDSKAAAFVKWIAERRILVRTLPVDVVRCRAGGFKMGYS